MIRWLRDWLRPDPPGIQHRYKHSTPPLRLSGERLSDFRRRQIDVVIFRSVGEVFDHTQDDAREAA